MVTVFNVSCIRHANITSECKYEERDISLTKLISNAVSYLLHALLYVKTEHLLVWSCYFTPSSVSSPLKSPAVRPCSVEAQYKAKHNNHLHIYFSNKYGGLVLEVIAVRECSGLD